MRKSSRFPLSVQQSLLRRGLLFALACGAFGLLTTSVSANTYYVSATSGNDSNSGTQASPFLTITRGLQAVTAGDTVYVRAGVYPEVVQISTSGTSAAPITLSAYPGELPLISGSGTGNASNVILTNVSNFTIDGFEVANNSVVRPYPDFRAGISVYGQGANINIKNNFTFR